MDFNIIKCKTEKLHLVYRQINNLFTYSIDEKRKKTKRSSIFLINFHFFFLHILFVINLKNSTSIIFQNFDHIAEIKINQPEAIFLASVKFHC